MKEQHFNIFLKTAKYRPSEGKRRKHISTLTDNSLNKDNITYATSTSKRAKKERHRSISQEYPNLIKEKGPEKKASTSVKQYVLRTKLKH